MWMPELGEDQAAQGAVIDGDSHQVLDPLPISATNS